VNLVFSGYYTKCIFCFDTRSNVNSEASETYTCFATLLLFSIPVYI